MFLQEPVGRNQHCHDFSNLGVHAATVSGCEGAFSSRGCVRDDRVIGSFATLFPSSDFYDGSRNATPIPASPPGVFVPDRNSQSHQAHQKWRIHNGKFFNESIVELSRGRRRFPPALIFGSSFSARLWARIVGLRTNLTMDSLSACQQVISQG